MIDYRAPLGDILFALRHAAGAGRLPGWDDETAGELLGYAARLVDEVVAPLDPIADATPARIVDGRVRVAPGFVDAYRAWREGGWPGLSFAPEHGGQGLPHTLTAVITEMLAGACVSFEMMLSLAQAAARTIAEHGSPAQRDRYLPLLASGDWLATMAMTEPQAGSDLGLARTTATPDGDAWRLSGGKVFITGGDQDMTGRVVHLVLARTPDAPPGVKGLSLFLCPSDLPDGRRNAVSALRVEEKMGLHASPTCQMAFDGAWAEMLGGPGEGLARMFTMMNAQRLDVALQGVAQAEVAGQRSRAYAAQRRQGRAGGGAGPDPLSAHADVRRMLLGQMALALGGRAMVYRTLVEMELGERPALVDFMTPVCKAFASEAATAAAQDAIQIHGGYGFLREYRVEQILRDSRIFAIYEGANAIQAATLAGRLLRAPGGAPAAAFRADVEDALTAASAVAASSVGGALAEWNAATRAMRDRPDGPGVAAVDYLRLTGLVALGAAWARLETAAGHVPGSERLRAVAAFVHAHVMPETKLLAARCQAPVDLADVDAAVLA